MADIFISYARAERAKAENIKSLLEDIGLSVFFDVDGLDGGDVFPDVLDREVKTAGVVLGLWSPLALSRPWIKTECLIGKDRGVLIPVSIEPINPLTDVPAAFYGLQHIELSNFRGDTTDEAWVSLIKSLARTLERPALIAAERKAHQNDGPVDEALRIELERMRAELDELRNRSEGSQASASITDLPVVHEQKRQKSRKSKPARSENVSSKEKLELETANVSFTTLALVLGAVLSQLSYIFTDNLSWNFGIAAPLIALLISTSLSRPYRIGFAVFFFAGMISYQVTDQLQIGDLGGLGALAGLICLIKLPESVYRPASKYAMMGIAVLWLLSGLIELSFSYDYPNIDWRVFGNEYMTVSVILAAWALRHNISVFLGALIAGSAALALLHHWVTFDTFLDLKLGELEVHFGWDTLRFSISSWISIQLAGTSTYAVLCWSDTAYGLKHRNIALAALCILWAPLGHEWIAGIGEVLAGLEPTAYAQLEGRPVMDTIIVTGVVAGSFNLDLLAALAGSLLLGGAFRSRPVVVPIICILVALAGVTLLRSIMDGNWEIDFGVFAGIVIGVWIGTYLPERSSPARS